MREFAERAETGVLADLESQPEIQAKLRTAIARVQTILANYDRARELLETSRDQQRGLFPDGQGDLADDELLVAKVHIALALLALREEHLDSAEAHYRDALEIRREILGETHPYVAFSLVHLGELSRGFGRLEDAAAYHRDALAIREAAYGAESAEVATAQAYLADVLSLQGRSAEAGVLAGSSLATHERLFGAEHPRVAGSLALSSARPSAPLALDRRGRRLEGSRRLLD